jgi:hypothetical protein
MVTSIGATTEAVVTDRVTDAAPAATVALAGTAATAGLEDVRVTRAPPAGAAPFSATVAFKELVPTTLLGERVNEYATAEGVVVRAAPRDTPALAAVMFVDPELDGGSVAIANVATVAPAATVRLGGTVARVVTELVSVTTAPPAGAGPLSVTVPVAPYPPMTLAWLSATDVRVWAAARQTPPTNMSRPAAQRPKLTRFIT